jgi:hypothetical protein
MSPLRDLEDELRSAFAAEWLAACRFANPPTEQAAEAVVSFSVETGQGVTSLGVTSHYTGSSYQLDGWNGDAGPARDFVRCAGRTDGELVWMSESRGKGWRRRGPLWQELE